MTKGDIVLMDTNVIIEAHLTRCWRAVVNAFKVETVEKCCEEAATGDKRRAGYVVIDVEAMKKSVLIHQATLSDFVIRPSAFRLRRACVSNLLNKRNPKLYQ